MIKEDCFAYKNKTCRVLNTLECKKKECKFYASNEEVNYRDIERDIRKYADRVRRD